MKRVCDQQEKQMLEYVLYDYQFLEDYEVVDSDKANKYSFVACIRKSQQKVRFIKRKYNEEQFQRFRALHKLFKSGIVLADNMFILEECEELYYYVIEAEIEVSSSRFKTLHHYLYYEQISEQEKRMLLSKIKILVDCVHQQGESYAGLDPRKIIIDDQKNLYLTPFDLQFQLKTDNYSRAYYSPEILSKMDKSENEISEEMMQKWDIWSFGCICMEVLAFSSPIFMATSLQKQLKQIGNMNIANQFMNYEDSIKNVLVNSLMVDMNLRTISTSIVSSRGSVEKNQIQSSVIQTASNICIDKKEQLNNGRAMRQLNIHQSSEGNCTLILNFYTLSNIAFEKELHISLHLSKEFHFYIDFDEKISKKYELNRKITIKGSFDDFQKWMSQPIVVQLKEDGNQSQISICLQTLIIIQDGKRIWKEPLLGSYCSNSDNDFPKARIKLRCIFITPEAMDFSSFEALNHRKQGQYNIETSISKIVSSAGKEKKNSCQKQNKNDESEKMVVKPSSQEHVLKDIKSNIVSKAHKVLKPERIQRIPSISQISQNISLLTQELKRKILRTEQFPSDQIQKQLSSLLEIE